MTSVEQRVGHGQGDMLEVRDAVITNVGAISPVDRVRRTRAELVHVDGDVVCATPHERRAAGGLVRTPAGAALLELPPLQGAALGALHHRWADDANVGASDVHPDGLE